MVRLSALATLVVCLTCADAFGQQTRAELLAQQRPAPIPRSGRGFDNHTGLATPAGEVQQMSVPSTVAPAPLLAQPFGEARASARAPTHPAWAAPVIVRFRRSEAGWVPVGVRRGPEPTRPETSR